jgi:hypothetical protein
MTITRRYAILGAMALGALLAPVSWQTALADSDKLMSATSAELAQARRATAKYHNIDVAFADGFVDADFYLAGVGCHLLNPGLLDGSFEVTQPEILIYKDCTPGQGGKAELRAIEYVTLCGGPPTCTLPAPEGFTGDDDVWTPFTDGSLWTLHVWTWRNNPDGIFVKVNPRIPD